MQRRNAKDALDDYAGKGTGSRLVSEQLILRPPKYKSFRASDGFSGFRAVMGILQGMYMIHVAHCCAEKIRKFGIFI